jgi:hypothetical protein
MQVGAPEPLGMVTSTDAVAPTELSLKVAPLEGSVHVEFAVVRAA